MGKIPFSTTRGNSTQHLPQTTAISALSHQSSQRRRTMTEIASVDDSHDVLLRIFQSLTLEERVRLSLVCKRWAGLLLSCLVIKTPASLRTLAVRAGDSLRVLDVSCAGRASATPAELLEVASGAPGLTSLVMFSDEDAASGKLKLGGFSLPEAIRLSSLCRALGDSSRCIISVSGSCGLAAALEALAGRHFVALSPPLQLAGGLPGFPASVEEGAAFCAALASPRLSALCVQWNARANDAPAAAWAEATVSQVWWAAAPGLWYLFLQGGRARQPVALTAPQLDATSEAAAPPSRLVTLSLSGPVPVQFASCLLTGAAGTLRRLSLQLGHTGSDDALTVGAVLALVGETLESVSFWLSVGGQHGTITALRGDYDAAFAALSALLRRPGCRLRALEFQSTQHLLHSAAGALTEQQQLHQPEQHPDARRLFEDFALAVSENASLTKLGLGATGMGDAEAGALGAALCARAVPLKSLVVWHNDAISGVGAAPSPGPLFTPSPFVLCR